MKRGLELNTEEIVDAEDVSDLDNQNSQELRMINPNHLNYSETEIINKLSKDYGADSDTGWEIRTFYTVTKKQLFENKAINFKVKGNKSFDIWLKTSDLIKLFDLKNEHETVSDGSGKIRIYIFQKYTDKNKPEYYLVRFGKKALDNPVFLKRS